MSNFRKPEFITFTGIDDRTDLRKANQLAERYPIEWGVLFSPTNRDARYPSIQGIREILDISGKKSAHLCGKYAREFAACGIAPAGIPLDKFHRCQINGVADIRHEIQDRIFDQYDLITIVQSKNMVFNDSGPFQLFDKSGGRGIMPSVLPRLPNNPLTIVGYSGGISPQTVRGYLSAITGGKALFWIDMETGVRTNGWFDLDKVAEVCRLVYET